MNNLKKVLVIGDVLIDRYLFATTERFCQEAHGIPIFDLQSEEFRPGGAANVAVNVAALGLNEVSVYLAGVVNPMTQCMLFKDVEIDTMACSSGQEMIKTRIVCNDKLVSRIDELKKFEKEDISHFGKKFVKDILPDLDKFDLIIISDYDKGTLDFVTPILLQEANCPIIVDSKRSDLSMFEGADYLNINEYEYSAQVSSSKPVIESLFDKVIVTLGNRGAELRIHEKNSPSNYTVHTEHFPAESVHSVDVTGCGDTHVAAFAIGILRDPMDPRNAIRFANQCAAIAVQKFGTTKVTKWDYLKNLEE